MKILENVKNISKMDIHQILQKYWKKYKEMIKEVIIYILELFYWRKLTNYIYIYI